MKRYDELTGVEIDTDIGSPNTHLEEMMSDRDEKDSKIEPQSTDISSIDEAGRKWEDLFMLIGVSFISIAFITIALVSVQKKRSRKIREEQEIAEEAEQEIFNESFEDQLATAKKKRSEQISSSRSSTVMIAEIAEQAQKDRLKQELSSSSTSSRIDKIIEDTPSIKKEVPASIIDEETGSANVHVESKKADIEDFLATFIPKKKAEEAGKGNDMASTIRSVIKNVELSNIEDSSSRQTAELELALKIAQKESQNKFSKLRKLDLGKLEGNERLDELSRQLNIDSSALNAKKKVSELQTNRGRISKLSKRFDVN
jgi:hypothetical protein